MIAIGTSDAQLVSTITQEWIPIGRVMAEVKEIAKELTARMKRCISVLDPDDPYIPAELLWVVGELEEMIEELKKMKTSG